MPQRVVRGWKNHALGLSIFFFVLAISGGALGMIAYIDARFNAAKDNCNRVNHAIRIADAKWQELANLIVVIPPDDPLTEQNEHEDTIAFKKLAATPATKLKCPS